MDFFRKKFRKGILLLTFALLYAFIATVSLQIGTAAFWSVGGISLLALVVVLQLHRFLTRLQTDLSIAHPTFTFTLAAAVGSGFAATLGIAMLRLLSASENPLHSVNLLGLWARFLTATLVMAPVLQLRQLVLSLPNFTRISSLGLLLYALGLALVIVFESGQEEYAFVLYGPTLLAAFWLEGSWPAVTAAVTAIAALAFASLGQNPYYGGQAQENLLGLQILLNTLMLLALCMQDFLKFVKKGRMLALLGSGCLTSGLLFYVFHQQSSAQDARRFRDLVLKAEQRIVDRLETCESVLQDFAGLVATYPSIDRQHWDTLIQSTRVMERLTEMSEIRFVKAVPALTPSSDQSFLLSVPIEDHKIFIGWIAGTFSVEKMMKSLLETFESELHFTLRPIREGKAQEAIYQTSLRTDPFEQVEPLILAGQRFEFQIRRGPQFQSSKDLTFAWVGCLGVLMTIALAYTLAKQQLIHQRAKDEVNRQMESIAERDRLWQTLTDFAPVGIFQINSAGQPTFSNRFWQDLIGGSSQNTTAEERWNRVHPEDRQRIFTLWKKFLQTGGVLREELRLVKTDSVTWVKVHSAPILGDKGQIKGFVGIALDITERKMREVEVEKERIKVIHSAKMASLGEMASGIAHEINNPLAVINAIACHLQLAQKQLPEDLVNDIRRLEEMAERISKIIRGLRAFSRNADKDPVRPVSLPSIIADTLALCRRRFEACSVNLEVQTIAAVQVGCRGGQLSQVLLNLLSNALDAACESTDRWVSIGTELHQDRVDIIIRDSGKGISPAIAHRIMEPFFTTKDVDKGTGLGLSIAKGIAEDHGGRLLFDASAPMTSFILELKILHSEAA